MNEELICTHKNVPFKVKSYKYNLWKQNKASFSIHAVKLTWRQRLGLIWMLLRHGEFQVDAYGIVVK